MWLFKGLALLVSTCFTHIHWSMNSEKKKEERKKCLIIFSEINKISESNLTSDLFDIRCHDTLDSGRKYHIKYNHRVLSLLSHLVIVIILK